MVKGLADFYRLDLEMLLPLERMGEKLATKLLREITLQAENEVIPVDYRLWEKWWWGGIILLLLAVYWVCRKMMGLI